MSATPPVLDGNGFMKRRSSSVRHVASCSPGPGASRSVSDVCCLCSAVLSWLLYPSGQSSARLFDLWAVFGLWPETGEASVTEASVTGKDSSSGVWRVGLDVRN